MTQYVIVLEQDGADDTIIAAERSAEKATIAANKKLKADAGPLARALTDNFEVLADRVADAFGGEACIILRKYEGAAS